MHPIKKYHELVKTKNIDIYDEILDEDVVFIPSCSSIILRHSIAPLLPCLTALVHHSLAFVFDCSTPIPSA